jgi:class 3 adenylate cyclase/tetratricopeptide (TPR) repeat protein
MIDDRAQVQAAMDALERLRGTVDSTVLDTALAPLLQRQAALAAPLPAAAPAVTLKTRQLTVLFADVVGSTALAQRLDSEEALQVLDGAVQRLADVVRAHNGTVLRFTGDGVKAAFGVAETREDDAERAVRAGLAMLAACRGHAAELLRAHGLPEFAVRVGVHTGSVTLGAGAEADQTAMGASVHIAARMEQSAPPGTLRISHDTWSHVRGQFIAELQPPLDVKGLDAPMQTYLVRGVAAGVAEAERGLPALPTPLVGRAAELQRLTETVARAASTRQGQLLLLLGDAGLGKSRLLRECLSRAQGCRVLSARLRPDGALRSWSVLRALVAGLCGVRDTDSADDARSLVEQGLVRWLGADGLADAQRIGHLAGLDFSGAAPVQDVDPRALREQALPAWRRVLRGLAEQGGALPVLVVEDLHWADASSIELLLDLQANAAHLPLAVLMTSRPAVYDRLPAGWPDGGVLLLQPLLAAQRTELAQTLLQRLDDAPGWLVQRLVEQADGNPYYMEELVRRLIDDGYIATGGERWVLRVDHLDALRLPTTLVNLLQARLDALPAAERHPVQCASIVGDVFWDSALAALDAAAVQALPALQQRGLVRAQPASAFEGTTEHRFDHHLLHQVTYDTVLKTARRQGHLAVARWLAEHTRGREAEFAAVTGEHAERGGDTSLAVDCFDQAAAHAVRRHANADALAHLQRALGLLGDSDAPRRLAMLVRLTDLADTVGDRALQRQALQARLALLESQSAPQLRAETLLASALLADRCGDSSTAGESARQAVALAEQCEAGDVAAEAHGMLCWLANLRGDVQAARAHADAGLRWAASVRAAHPATELKLLLLAAVVEMEVHHHGTVRTLLHDALQRSRALGAVRAQLGALDLLGNLAVIQGRWDEAEAASREMEALARRQGNQPRVGHALFRRAQVALAGADLATVQALGAEVLAIVQANGDRPIEAHIVLLMGQASAGVGDHATALQRHRQAAALFDELEQTSNACRARAHLALALSALGRPAEATVEMDTVLAGLHAVPASAAEAAIEARWACVQVLQAAGDARAGVLLGQLAADLQAHLDQRTAEAPEDRARLCAAIPLFRAVAAGTAAVAA